MVSEDASFKKTQMCLRMVAKEFKFHGHQLKGPCNELRKAGKSGKYGRNVARDIARVDQKLRLDQDSLLNFSCIIWQWACFFP